MAPWRVLVPWRRRYAVSGRRRSGGILPRGDGHFGAERLQLPDEAADLATGVDVLCVRAPAARRQPAGSPGSATMLRMRRGSGYEQAEAELCLVEAGEVGVVLSPPPRGGVIAEAAHRPLLGLRSDARPHRTRPAHMYLQVGLGPTPVCLKEAVGAVPRDEYWVPPGPRSRRPAAAARSRRQGGRPLAGSRG
jgi:hypothetical protein